MTEIDKIALDYLYERSRKLPDIVELHGCRFTITYAPIRQKNVLGITTAYNVLVSNQISVKQKQDVLFHELIHCYVIMKDPAKNTEEYIRELESEYYGITRLPKQVKIGN
jgi:hypothetical protein